MRVAMSARHGTFFASLVGIHAKEFTMSLSHTVKTAILGTPALLTRGIPGARAGDEYLAFNQTDLMSATTIEVKSPEFEAGQEIPFRYSADGQNISPPITWSNLPRETKSIALLVEDPDAPLPQPFVHWIAFNIDPLTLSLHEGVPVEEKIKLKQGKNSGLKIGWTGMAPPKGDTPHHYHFQVFALDEMLPLGNGIGRSALIKAMSGHVIARGELVGRFRR
jgi:Raf kinase inhibitor-like YbhB/YbcL family protein